MNVNQQKFNSYLYNLQVFDQDGNGVISRKNLAAVMKNLGEELTEDDLTDMMLEADKNGDGVVDFEEFVHVIDRKTWSKS